MHISQNPEYLPLVVILTCCGCLALICLVLLGIGIFGGLPRIKAVVSVGVNVGLIGLATVCASVINHTIDAIGKMPGVQK
jgi:hypothetical protein